MTATLLLYSMILASASSVAPSKAISDRVHAAEDAAVLSAIVDDRCKYSASHNERRYEILSDQTSTVSDVPKDTKIDSSASRSLALRNKAPHQLPGMTLCSAFKRVSRAKIDAAMHEKGWSGFYEVFPQASGISYFSLPGYSVDGAKAVVMFSGSCDLLCGATSYWVLKKIEGRWTVQTSVGGGIS